MKKSGSEGPEPAKEGWSKANLFGAWVKERRKALDLTQQDLAERAACAPVTITRIERGALRPSQQLAAILADALRIPPVERGEFLRLARAGASVAPEDRAELALINSEQGDARPPTNLPATHTPLIGREQEVADAIALLQPELTEEARPIRLLTLTGAPGIGKTSLALEVARRLLPAFQDGVFFVPLAPILRPEGVVPAIMQVLSLPDAGKQPPVTQLADNLRDRHVLLVLDNFEQVVTAGPQLLELLAQCSRLQMIVTSREALRIRGERLFPVQPLALPDAALLRHDAYPDDLTLGAVRDYPAIVLFEQRAREASSGFRITAENANAVAAICATLDGLPLAIELVAARLNLLSPKELLRRLRSTSLAEPQPGAIQPRHTPARPHETLRLAAGGKRDLPARHQTLRHAIGWSYDLLSEAEQRLFRRLSVFAGGMTLAAIEAVCDPVSDLGIDTLEGVSSLLAKNLLRRLAEESGDGTPGVRAEVAGRSSGEPRIEMLETVREYALEQLEQRGEEEGRVRRWHAEYYLALIETLRPHRTSDKASVWYDSLMRQRSNVHAALDWSLQVGEMEIAARMALELVELWIMGGFTDGKRVISSILARGQALSPDMRAKILLQGARLLIITGDLAGAEEWLNEGLPLLDALGREGQRAEQRALFLLALGGVALRREEWANARSHFGEVLTIYDESGEDSGREMLVRALNGLGEVSRAEHDYAQARDHYKEALALQKLLGEGYPSGVLLFNLSKAEIELGNYEHARAYLHDAIALYRRIGITVPIAGALNGLAEALVHEWATDKDIRDNKVDNGVINGRPVRMAGGRWTETDGLEALEWAVQLFAAAQAEHDAADYTLDPADLQERERAKGVAQAALGKDKWQAAWDRGRRLSIDGAVALALHPTESGIG